MNLASARQVELARSKPEAERTEQDKRVLELYEAEGAELERRWREQMAEARARGGIKYGVGG